MEKDSDIFFFFNHMIYKNEKAIAKDVKQVLVRNKDLYYSSPDGIFIKARTIFKNDEILKSDIEGLSEFAIGKNEEIAYTCIDSDGSTLLYKNNFLYAKATGYTNLFRLTYSPDGNKFYFIESRPRGGYYNAYYLHGDFPVTPKTRFTIVDNLKFSPDSKYIATRVEDLQGKQWYILTGKVFGPYKMTSSNYYFSEDSKNFFYRYYDKESDKWIDVEEKLEK